MVSYKHFDKITLILEILFALFAVIAIVQMLLILFGHSPTATHVLIALVAGIVLYLSTATYHFGKLNQSVKMIDRGLHVTNQRLVDMEERMNKRFLALDKRFLAIEKRLTKIEAKI